MWGGKATLAATDEASSVAPSAAGASGGASQQTSPPRPHSRFIPEAQRGWHVPTLEVQQSANANMRRSSSGAGANGVNCNVGSGSGSSNSGTYSMSSLLEIRRATWSQLASRWNGPRLASRKDQSRPASTALTDDDEDEDLQRTSDDDDDDEEAIAEQDEEDEDGSNLRRAHTRERSSSVPDLSLIERRDSDNGTYRARHRKQTLKKTHSPKPDDQPESTDGLSTPPLFIDVRHTTSRGSLNHIHYDHRLTPAQLTRQNSITPSLELQRSPSQVQPRGYEWRPYAESKKHSGHVPPSHRNPTAMQAFYDSHFGSSSGFRSVAGLADDFFHPLGSAKQVLSRLNVVSTGKDKKTAQRSSTPSESQARDSLMSWRTMPFTPAIFGMSASSSSMPTQQQQQAQIKKAAAASQHSTTTTSGAYEPELIPTVHRDPHAHRYFKQLDGNVVLLGGYRGSILRDAATHQMVWVPLKVGVGLRRPTLELGLGESAEEHSEDLIVADEMLSGVGNMVDTGRRLIARCTRKRTKVHSWGFDWRLSLGRSSVRLEAFLQQLWNDSAEREEDRRGAKVVAHSMGGLVALHALARTKNPRIFESLVFASTPFLGTANILGPFAFGDAALWNDEICSPRATFSFRASFYLLPTDPSKRGAADTRGGRCFEEEDGTPHDVDFLDPQTWDDLGLSPCVKRGARQKVLQAAGERARQERTTIGYQLEHSASQQSSLEATHSIDHSDPAKEKAARMPVIPGADMQMQGPEQDDEGAAEAVKKAQSLVGGHDDTDETLQPANRQSDEAAEQKPETEVKSDEDEESVSWSYLENTLAETRKFFHELRTSFKPEWHEQGLYPPVALLTSGRTPTVRGALVWPRGSEALAKQEARLGANAPTNESEDTMVEEKVKTPAAAVDTLGDAAADHWKRTARLCDYSRMLYAPGDGVILRRSATTLPGGWGTLLVKGAASADERGTHALTSDEGVVETSHRHVTLLSDVDGVGRCLEACRRARINQWPQSAQVISKGGA